MIPQLWTRGLEFIEWRQLHPNLDDREAEYLYNAELKMFQNYTEEIINQIQNRQARLTGDLNNLAADISTILTEGGTFMYKADYVGFKGQTIENPNTGVGAFVGSGTHLFRVGDLFSFDTKGNGQENNGIYKVLVETNQTQFTSPAIAVVQFILGLNNNFWEKVAVLGGTPV